MRIHSFCDWTPPSGRVLAFDACSGKPPWEVNPVSRDPADPAAATWARGSGEGFGGGNVYTTSVVALRGATGEIAWHL